MAKVTVTIELDERSYREKYGPGSEHWEKYQVEHTCDDYGRSVRSIKPASDYKPLEGKLLNDAIIYILHEGFYDWASEGWLRVGIDGKAVRQCCNTLEGESHLQWCETIAGAEQSLD